MVRSYQKEKAALVWGFSLVVGVSLGTVPNSTGRDANMVLYGTLEVGCLQEADRS